MSASYLRRVTAQAEQRSARDVEIVTAPPEAARAAGLRYVDDRQPGLRRRRAGKKVRQGKRWAETFLIEGPDGRPVRDHATLERIAKLAIPPAWEQVWICPDPQGHLQATGRDARGRKQYRYHPRWREERDSTKYSRLIDFGRALPAMRRRLAADLRLPGLPRRKVLATVVKLLETTFIRVGNEEYARSNRSFGLTTLEDRHVDVHPSEVRFHFRGKSGVFHQVSVRDPAIARIVRRCRDLPGQELFQYLDEEGAPATIDSADVNQYIREVTGGEFTAKDFRTWAGTVLASQALQELARAMTRAMTRAPARAPRAAAALRRAADHRMARRQGGGARGRSGSPRPSRQDVVRAIERVAARLGNTPSVCRKCYVHPEVIASYMDGTLVTQLATSKQTRPPRGRSTGLRAEEAALMALLRRRLGDERRGDRLTKQLRRSLRAVKGAA
jgi:DNA topoisomerase-1